MLGSKEIRDFTPEKAVFGGYDARSVDMMLDQAADDMEALERENAELRAKLKVMVDKIEEYRRIESGIRPALMTAQGMADKTKKEASEQADQTRTQAQEDAEQLKRETKEQCEAIVRRYQVQASQEQARLRLAQKEAASFIEKMTRAFREESERIAASPQKEGVEFTSISDHTVHSDATSETIEGHVEGPAELKIPKSPEENPGTDIPADILKIFADAKHTSHLDGIEQDAYTVEVSGSQNHNNFIGE